METGRVVAYVRVSTVAQSELWGLESQRQQIVAYAAVNGLMIDDWYTDIESGSHEVRDDLVRLRSDVSLGLISVVIVYKLDRLSRDLLLSEVIFREFGALCRVVSVSEALDDSFTGELMRRILGAFAQYERCLITSRVKGGKLARVRTEGTYMGGGGCYGFLPVGDGLLEADEVEAEGVRLIFALKESGLSLRGIARRLNESGYVARGGGAFCAVKVKRVLDRAGFYSGRECLNGGGDGVVAHRGILVDSRSKGE